MEEGKTGMLLSPQTGWLPCKEPTLTYEHQDRGMLYIWRVQSIITRTVSLLGYMVGGCNVA